MRYLIAGVSRVSIWKVLAIMVVVRVPSAILHAAIGAGVTGMSKWWLVAFLAFLALAGLIALMYGERIRDWFEERALRQLTGDMPSGEAKSLEARSDDEIGD